MDCHRLPFLLSPHGHHQRALLYHPRPRHHNAMLSLPIYDGLLSPSNRHSAFPRPYPEDYPPFLAGPSPGAYGMMGSYPMPVDYGYGFLGGYPPLPIPQLSSHGSFMDFRKPSDCTVKYQSHMDALQDHMSNFLGLTSPQDSVKPIHCHGDEPLDWKGVEASHLGREGRTSGDKPAPRLPALPRLRAVGNRPVDHFVSPPRRGSLSGWHSTLTPPPLHLPSDFNRQPKLEPDLKNRKPTSGVLSGKRINDLFNEHYVAKMPKLPPLVVGNRDLAKKLTVEENCEVLNLSRSSGKSRARCRMVSNSPECNRTGKMTFECRTWEPADGGHRDFEKNRSPSDGGFVRDLITSETTPREFQHPTGHHPQFPPKSPNRIHSTASTHPPPHPNITCMTDIEAMRNAYIASNPREGSLSSSVGRSESESSVGFSPGLLPPPPPLGFRGKGCFGVKRRRPVSPPRAVRSDTLSSQFRTECGRIWEWSGENCSGDLEHGQLGKSFVEDAEGRDGSDLYHDGHIAIPSNVREESSVTEPIRIKEEPKDGDPFTPTLIDVLGSHNVTGAFDSDEGHSLTFTTVDIDRPGKYDHDQTNLPEDTTVPFADSAAEFELGANSGFPLPSASEKRKSDGAGEEGNAEFRCHLCNYNGRSQHCLDKHFRAHGQACKICRYCLKAFERPSDLVRHEERHQKRNHVLASTTSEHHVPSSRFVLPGKKIKRRHPWTCRQCHFTCREARRMIHHTRRAHPIFVNCPICRERFGSEAEVATHRAECHPVAVGRLDTYHRGVLTATRLVACGVIGEQEISIDLSELSELPLDCSGIPVVSDVCDVQCILGKDFLDDPGPVGCSDLVSHVGELSPIEPGGMRLVPQSPIDHLCPTSPKNPPELINIESPQDVDATFDRTYPGFTSTPTSLTIPITVGDACHSPPVSGSLDDTPRENLRLSPKHLAPKSEKSPIESVRQAQCSREAVAAASGPSLQDSSPFSDPSRSEDSPKFRSASHRKPLLLTKLLTKPSPAKPALPPVNKRVLENREKVIYETVCALDEDKAVSTDLDTERINTAENGKGLAERTILKVTISKKEQTTLKKDRSADSPLKTEISTLEEGIRLTSSRNVFAERNGVEKNSETYVCVRCKYSTTAKFKYQQHLKAHTGRFICKRCSKACIKSSDLYRHWVTHNVKGPDGFFACDSCDFTSPQKYVIEDHMKTHYTLHPEQPRRPPGAMSRCGICRKNVLRSRLFEHKRVVHGKFFLQPRDPNTDANGNSIKSCPKVFTCPQCDRRFTTPSYLLRHHFGHHRPSDGPGELEANPCGCRFCGVKFEDVDRLQEHEINHIVQTCSDAEYVKRRRKRKRTPPPVVTPVSAKPAGVGTSPGRRRLGCPHCKKTFKAQYFLDQHLRVHSGECPYVCLQCGAGFAIFQLLNIHRRFKCAHRKSLTSTNKPLLNACDLSMPSDALGNASSGSVVNGSDGGKRKERASAVDSVERSIEVSC